MDHSYEAYLLGPECDEWWGDVQDALLSLMGTSLDDASHDELTIASAAMDELHETIETLHQAGSDCGEIALVVKNQGTLLRNFGY